MNGHPFKASIFVFFMCLAILTGGIKSFAQDDNSDENTQETLNQIHDLEVKLQQANKSLDAAQQSGNQSDTETAVTQAPVAQASPQQAAPEQADDSAPSSSDQTTSTSPAQTAPDRTVSINTTLNSLEVNSAQTASTTSVPTTTPTPTQTVPSAPVQTVPPAPASSNQTASSTGNTLKISGEVRASMGVYSSGNAVFTRANADLNEKNYRLVSDNALNNDINTYDPALYSRLKVVMDASVASAVVSVHLNVSVDPWSFTGKTKTQLVTTPYGDTVKVQYLTWGNTGYTVNSTFNTMRFANGIEVPEIKTNGNMVPATTVPNVDTYYQDGDTFNLPAAKIDYSFFPFREAWVDVKPTDELKLRIFPMGFEDQALSTDDPLKLSNSTEWWAESPWLDGWQQGNLNTGLTPVSFTKGQWDKSLSFFTKDSDGVRLTALRGVSLDWKPGDETSWDTTIASPKTLWQDYGDITALAGSSRLKQDIGDSFYIGALGNMHQGFDLDNQIDAENYTGGVDSGAMLLKNLKLNAEYAESKSIYDETSPEYSTQYGGNAYFVSLTTASNPEDEDILKKDYFGLLPVEKTEDFYKSTIYFARMDEGFESSLSDYHETRSDSFWADNLTFYPSDYRYMPGIGPTLSENDLDPFAIGNGIDYGRSVINWRGDVNLMDGKLQGLAAIRHVTDHNGNNVETASRLGMTYQVTDKLTTKALLLWDALPNTTAGIDPFQVYDPTGVNYNNDAVPGGKDPSLKTGSLGARYQLTDWAAINGVWKYTNDFVEGTNEFPQTVMDSISTAPSFQNGQNYRQYFPFIYDQSYFEQAPYPYYNIFKTGLELTPSEKWHLYLDYTRNPNRFAGNFDDNMNHEGIEASYVPTPKIGFFASTVFSQGYDVNRLVNDNELDYRDYINFFFEMRMILPKDLMMSIQYGVGPSYDIQTSTTTPNLTYSSTVLETQHLVRIVFDKKF